LLRWRRWRGLGSERPCLPNGTEVHNHYLSAEGVKAALEMSSDPSSFFGGLTRGCIRDDWVDDGSAVRESVLFTILGMGCSVLTLYVLSVLGFFV